MFLTIFASGCDVSDRYVYVKPTYPAIPAELTEACRDPGVGSIQTVQEAVTVIGENRVYAACSRRKHRDMVAFHLSVVGE